MVSSIGQECRTLYQNQTIEIYDYVAPESIIIRNGLAIYGHDVIGASTYGCAMISTQCWLVKV